MKKLFIETLSIFNDNPEDERMSNDYWSEYTFDLNEVNAYNKSTQGYTTIDLNSGRIYTISIKYEDFIDLMKSNFEHKTIIDSKALYEFKEQ